MIVAEGPLENGNLSKRGLQPQYWQEVYMS